MTARVSCPGWGQPHESGLSICAACTCGRVLTLEEARAFMTADREAAERGEPGLGANGLFCRRCGGDLVEVDNPLRREFRHRRGQECRP